MYQKFKSILKFKSLLGLCALLVLLSCDEPIQEESIVAAANEASARNARLCGNSETWTATLMGNTAAYLTRSYTVKALGFKRPMETKVVYYFGNHGLNSGPVDFVISGADYNNGAPYTLTANANTLIRVEKTFECPGELIEDPTAAIDVKIVHTYSTSQKVTLQVYTFDGISPPVINESQNFQVAPARTIQFSNRSSSISTPPGANLYYKINAGSWTLLTSSFNAFCLTRGNIRVYDGDVVSVAIEQASNNAGVQFLAGTGLSCPTSGTVYCGTRAGGSSFTHTVSANTNLSLTGKTSSNIWLVCP